MAFGETMHLPLPGEEQTLVMGPVTRDDASTMPRFARNKGVARFLSPAFTDKLRNLSKPIGRMKGSVDRLEEDANIITYGLFVPSKGNASRVFTGLAEIEYNPEDAERVGLRLATWRPEMRRRGIGRAAVRGLVYVAFRGENPFDSSLGRIARVDATAYSKNVASLLLFRGEGFNTRAVEDAQFPLPEDKAAGVKSQRTTLSVYNPQVFDSGGDMFQQFASLRILEWGHENIRFPTSGTQ